MDLFFSEYQSLERAIELFPLSHKLALAVSCCTRLLFFYRKFSTEEKWGNSSILENAINEMWKSLEEEDIDRVNWENTYAEWNKQINIHNVYPGEDEDDLEEFGYDSNLLYTQAQEAVISISITLKIYFSSYPQKETIRVVKHTRDAIEYHIGCFDEDFETMCEGKNIDEIGEVLSNHPLAIQELEKETNDLQLLQNSSTLDKSLLELLRNSSIEQGENMIKMFDI